MKVFRLGGIELALDESEKMLTDQSSSRFKYFM